MIAGSFIFFLVLFLLVGTLSGLKSHGSDSDYLLAGRTVPPLMTALSAVATNNSGFMFIGMIGFTYEFGISSIWVLLGFALGDLYGAHKIYPHIRKASGDVGSLSYAETLSKWGGGKEHVGLRIAAALLTIFFLGTYAAVQFKSGGKALNVLFDWPEHTGALLGALIVLAYCLVGGFRASLWTDMFQSTVMICAMTLLFFAAIAELGGLTAFVEGLSHVSPNYTNIFPTDMLLGPFLGPIFFCMGWFFGGFTAAGQPHVMVRYMAMRSVHDMPRVRLYYFSWLFTFYVLVIGCGLAARLLLHTETSFDPELALPTLARDFLPHILTGFVLAGLFSATLSTADSQVLSCSAAIARDFSPDKKEHSALLARFGTLITTVGALLIAVYGRGSVFDLVLLAWAVLASAFTPLIIVYILKGRPSQAMTFVMMTTGVLAMLVWREIGLQTQIYEVVPGLLVPLAIYYATQIMKRREQA